MPSQTSRFLPWLVASAVLAGLAWAFPPVRIRSIRPATQAQAEDFVATFWRDTLLPAARGRATDATELLAAIDNSPAQVRERHGRTVGLSSSYFLFIRGVATVVSADADAIALAVQPDSSRPDILVPLGFVFGNAVRDATGLLDPSRYPNAQEFNDLSARLNEIVERDVLPEFQRVALAGKRVAFAGCVEVADEEADLRPLKLVPIYVKAE